VRLVTENPQNPALDGTDPQAGPGRLSRRRRMQGVAVLSAVGVIAGVGGSWAYNSGYRTRAADSSAIIVTGADLPQFVDHAASTHEITMPIGNYSPYAVTIYQVEFTNAPDFAWNGDNAVIQPGQTAYLTITTPASCPVDVPPGRMPSNVAQATVHLRTVSGGSHGIKLGFSGVLGYAVKQCGHKPSASAKP
jgi:hypothetical protein